MRILIVEDDTALAGFVRKGLESEHFVVDTSFDGEPARAMALEFDYDLLILDLNLPQLDGVILKGSSQPQVERSDPGVDRTAPGRRPCTVPG